MAIVDVKVITRSDGSVGALKRGNQYYIQRNESPKKGDLAYVVKGWGNQEPGEVYEVINDDHILYDEISGNSTVFILGKEVDASTSISDVIIFGKVNDYDTVVLEKNDSCSRNEVGDCGIVTNVGQTIFDDNCFVQVPLRSDSGNVSGNMSGVEEIRLATEEEKGDLQSTIPENNLDVQEGDEILIHNPTGTDGEYNRGDVLTVSKTDPDHIYPHVYAGGFTVPILNKEYIIIDTSQRSKNSKETKKQRYSVGDKVEVVEPLTSDFSEGEVVEIKKLDYGGDGEDLFCEYEDGTPALNGWLYEKYVKPVDEPIKIRMLNDCEVGGYIKDDIFSLSKDFQGDLYFFDNDRDRRYPELSSTMEYEILTRLEPDGEVEMEEGDSIKILKDDPLRDYLKGDVFQIVRGASGNFYFLDRSGDRRYLQYRNVGDYTVIKKEEKQTESKELSISREDLGDVIMQAFDQFSQDVLRRLEEKSK